jgi:Transposase, Mutator family/Major Facilitator Superfamily
VLTEVGEVELDVPRDRAGSFEPRIVKKRQRRLSGVEELVISLAANGLTTGEIDAHVAEVYGAEVSRDTISRITDRVLEEMAAWQSRPLASVYPVIFSDAIQVKIRDGQVGNRPVETVIGVSVDGTREVIGLWVGEGGEGAKYWHQILSEIKNRAANDVLFLVCDGLRGLVESVADVWPLAIVQTRVLHLVRNTVRYASKAHWYELARDLRLVYTAATEQAARKRFDESADKWGRRLSRRPGHRRRGRHPLTLTILSAAVPVEKRGLALGAWGGIGGLAVAIGPLVGGAVVDGISWQWIFWLNVPIGLLLAPLARRCLAESYGPSSRLDLRGLTLVSAGLAGARPRSSAPCSPVRRSFRRSWSGSCAPPRRCCRSTSSATAPSR